MATTEQHRDEADEAILFEWRFGRLMEAGYLPDQANILASTKGLDVQLAELLLARGCPRETAMRILI